MNLFPHKAGKALRRRRGLRYPGEVFMSSKRQNEGGGTLVLLLAAVTGLALIMLTAVVSDVTKLNKYLVGAVAAVLYLGAMAVLYTVVRRRNEREAIEASPTFNMLMSEVVRNMETPAVITIVDGRIIWANRAMLELCAGDRAASLTGRHFDRCCGRQMSEIFSATKPEGIELRFGDRSFRALSYLLEMEDRDYWMTVLDETTELCLAREQTEHAAPAVCYAVLDNLDEIAQYARVSYREAVNRIETELRDWAVSLGGFVREYDRDKYMILFPSDRLGECRENGFDILDRIRDIGLGAGSISVTVSLGLSAGGADIADREKEASYALETALQRGGDQAVLRTPEGTEYYGGRTKVDQKRSKISSRVISDRLIQLISEAGNVLIMGHKNPDFDCIGACVGMARLAKWYNPQVKVVTDRRNPNFTVCTADLLAEYPDSAELFVDGAAGLNRVRSDTLLIVVDVNNLKIVESPEIVERISRLVIIDHHRKVADFDQEPEIAYIEPAASSACELVTEMLQLSAIGNAPADAGGLSRPEANIMLAGIMLDTRNFTRSSSEGTFSAALYLRGAGASSEVARTFFFDDISGFVTEARLGSNVRLYRDRIAITVTDVDGAITAENRVAASRSAENLLTVKQVGAAFVMLRNGDTVLISARSDGSINVQLILEKMGGGGHFDAAGAQITGTSARKVMENLKAAIDAYLDSEG
jgi:c-di-AMP phosphodiesterase-like protein